MSGIFILFCPPTGKKNKDDNVLDFIRFLMEKMKVAVP